MSEVRETRTVVTAVSYASGRAWTGPSGGTGETTQTPAVPRRDGAILLITEVMLISATGPKWVTTPPELVLATLETGLRDRIGAVLIGSAGVGKTWLARTAADRFASQFGRVDWVTATAPAVPFSAFSHLIDVPSTGKTAAVLRDARESLGDGRLLVVDDAHLLDKLSAAL
ncbi:MAG: hypothetical protein QOI29_4593, partial [Mycobacterium sp.]|nr:hypothetical protein [Mycobacterium sp.]